MDAEKKPIVVVGSINIDLVANTEHLPVEGETISGKSFEIHPGGKGANQAVAVARLGYPVRMIGRLGDDSFAAQLRSSLHDNGVDVSGVMTSPGTSGVAVIMVSANGANNIVVIPGANALLTPADLDEHAEVIRSAGMVLTQLELPIETVEYLAALCGQEHVPLMLDPAPAQPLTPRLLARTTWFTPNETEAAFFLATSRTSGEPAEVAAQLRTLGLENIVLKLGGKGALIDAHQADAEFVRPFEVNIVDTTAAGDAFNGAFATGLMMGMTTAASGTFAAAAAAISVTRMGAQPSMPSMAEVEALLKTARRKI